MSMPHIDVTTHILIPFLLFDDSVLCLACCLLMFEHPFLHFSSSSLLKKRFIAILHATLLTIIELIHDIMLAILTFHEKTLCKRKTSLHSEHSLKIELE